MARTANSNGERRFKVPPAWWWPDCAAATDARPNPARTPYRKSRMSLRVRHGLVGELQPPVDDRQPLEELRLGDAQRRVHEEVVPAHEGVEAVLAEVAAQLRHRAHLVRPGVERSQ